MNSTDDTAHKQISTVINRFLCSGMYLMDAPHVRQYNSIQMWNEQYKREFRLVLVSFQNKNCFSIFIFILFLSFNFTYTHTLTGRSCSTNNLSFASEQWIAIVFFFILLCLLMFVGFSVPFSTKLLLFDSYFFCFSSVVCILCFQFVYAFIFLFSIPSSAYNACFSMYPHSRSLYSLCNGCRFRTTNSFIPSTQFNFNWSS